MGHCVAMCYDAVGRVIVPLSRAYNFASVASEKFFGNILPQNSHNRYRYRNRYGTDISLKITRIHYPVDFERKPKKNEITGFYRYRYRNRPSLISHFPVCLSIPWSISVKNRKSSDNRNTGTKTAHH